MRVTSHRLFTVVKLTIIFIDEVLNIADSVVVPLVNTIPPTPVYVLSANHNQSFPLSRLPTMLEHSVLIQDEEDYATDEGHHILRDYDMDEDSDFIEEYDMEVDYDTVEDYGMDEDYEIGTS